MEDLRDIKTLLERIERNIDSSAMSKGDKDYLNELLELVREKLSRIDDDKTD